MLSRITVVLGLLVALAGPGLAATGADPLKLALQRSDMPSTVEGSVLGPSHPARESQESLRFIGTGLKGADYSYTWPAGGTVSVPGVGPADKQWHVAGEVIVAPSVAAARKLFADGTAAQTGFFSDFPTDGLTHVGLPVGDEQFGLLGPDAGGPQAMVFVRKGAAVWELRVGHSPAQWTVSKAQVVALLKTYALEQKSRVGAG